MKKYWYLLFKRKIYHRALKLQIYKLEKQIAILKIKELQDSVDSTRRLLHNPNVHFSPYFGFNHTLIAEALENEEKIEQLKIQYKL